MRRVEEGLRGSAAGRLRSIDALRGLAVLFMIDQHVIYWLCAGVRGNEPLRAISALGGLAAPIFVVLAGLGTTLVASRHENIDRILMLRGVGIIGFGYLLNFLTPSWFWIGSWYVLHMIGLGIALSSVLRRASTPLLLSLLVGILLATAAIQDALNTPFLMDNRHMANPNLSGGILRYALAEGYFPVFPWMSFFIAGMLGGRWLLMRELRKLRYLAVACLFTSAVLSSCYLLDLPLTRNEVLTRVFKVTPSFYPALTPMSLFLIAMASFFILSFSYVGSRLDFKASNFLVCLGRTSLTVLVVHVVLIRESAVRLEFWRTFSGAEALAITLGVMVLFSVLALWWRKIGFRFGAEWLLRRVAG